METKKRLIDANAVLAELDKFANPMPNKSGYDFLCGIATAITEIEDAPTVDAVEVVHGRWNKHDWGGVSIKGFMVCSACNVMIPTADDTRYCLHRLNYCPNCGAKMDGDGNG